MRLRAHWGPRGKQSARPALPCVPLVVCPEDSPEGATAGRSPRRAAGRAASGVAVPLAFFCTLFFRHRKKSVSAPGTASPNSRRSRRANPHRGRGMRLRAHWGFRGKQSARPALPCVPLVVCPEDSPEGYRRTKPATRSGAGRLWSRRAAGFLLHTFLSPPKEKCERPLGRQVPPRRSRRANPHRGRGMRLRAHWASGQTIGAARTAVRPACCLPRGQPRRGYRRTKPATRSGAGRLGVAVPLAFFAHFSFATERKV